MTKNLRIIIREKPKSVLFPSADDDVNVLVNENGVPCVVLPVIGDSIVGLLPQSVLMVCICRLKKNVFIKSKKKQIEQTMFLKFSC